jgi:hypothetical protein
MKPSELFEGENSSLKKTYDEATKPLEKTLFKSFKLFLDEKCYDEELYGDGKYDKKIFNWAFQAGKDSMREEIFDFIMKNLYNEQTCEKINEFFNKIK